MSDWITDAASLIAAGWRVQWSHPDVNEGRCVDTAAALHIQKTRAASADSRERLAREAGASPLLSSQPPKRTTLARLPAIAPPPIPSEGLPTKPARRDPRRDED